MTFGKDWSRKYLALETYFDNTDNLFISAQTDRQVESSLGIRTKYFIKRLPIKNTSIKRNAIKYIKNKQLPYHAKMVKVMELAIQDAMLTLLNKEYGKGKKTNFKGMTRVWDDAAEELKFNKTKASVRITFRDNMRVRLDRFRITTELRDPAYGYLGFHVTGTKGGTPNPNKGRKRRGAIDPIHIGASKLFDRYAITSVKLFGRQITAGRKGTEFEGLGLEPLGVKPKSAASMQDYVPFKRVGYPGRGSPDSLSGALGKYPVFVQLLLQSYALKYIFSQATEAADQFHIAWMESRGTVLERLTNNLNRITSKIS